MRSVCGGSWRLWGSVGLKIAVQLRGERSQRRFAQDLGVFEQYVNRCENGQIPGADFLLKVALKEEISIDWLLLSTGRMKLRR